MRQILAKCGDKTKNAGPLGGVLLLENGKIIQKSAPRFSSPEQMMRDAQKPTYAVIIPHFNDPDRLRRCLTALMPQTGDDTEVIVADNGSSCDLSGLEADFPDVRIVVEPASGAGLARNAGVAASTAPWLLFIDADCVPAPDWLAVGRRVARPDTVIGGRVDVFDETPGPRSGAEAFETVFAFHMRDYFERKAFLGAGNLILSREVFEATGGFRTGVSEDVEWSQRAASKGFELAFEDDFAAKHPSRSDWRALSRKWRRLASEEFQLRGAEARGKWIAKGLAMPASVIAHIPKVLSHPALNGREKGRALVTLLRLRLMRMVWMLGQAATGRP